VKGQRNPDAQGKGDDSTKVGLKIYLLFFVSWFLHFPSRIPILAAIRFDLMLVLALTIMAYQQSTKRPGAAGRTATILAILLGYAILATPFVEWPGSVWKGGLPEFAKAVMFFYFTVAFIRCPRDLRLFIYTFVGCQVVRIVEPLFLHLSTGYWGSAASMEGGAELLYRLSGAPNDTINPNGLAFLVCSVLPFLYFLSGLSRKHRVALVVLAPICLYTFTLTGSRSGMVGIAVVTIGIIAKSQYRVLIGSLIAVAAVISFTMMSADMQDRYLSVFGKGEKNAATANERIDGMRGQLDVALRRPLLGHGLGTSLEANLHFTKIGPYVGKNIHAHNLLLETWQEIGIVGVIIFGFFIASIFRDFKATRKAVLQSPENHDPLVAPLMDAMQVWIVMNLVSSLTSYGLSSYDWYLFAGLSVAIQKIANEHTDNSKETSARRQPARSAGRLKHTFTAQRAATSFRRR
jgi:O-antigen ligase